MSDSLEILQKKLTLPFSPIQELHSSLFSRHKIRFIVKRDDLLDVNISGNKWRKLKFNLLDAKEKNHSTLLSFGGAYSNHIVALAAAGQQFGFATIGVIRGEKEYVNNSSLSYARSCGMKLHFVSRDQYRHKTDADFLNRLTAQYGSFYLLPEGGSNCLALQGCAEINAELDRQIEGIPDYLMSACGTAGTLSGLLASKHEQTKILGVAVLKNASFLNDAVKTFLQSCDLTVSVESISWSILTNYHFSGYAKYSDELIDFIQKFREDFAIQLEPVYTGKLFYAMFDLLEQGYFPTGSTVVALHTGGLQGLNGLPDEIRAKILGIHSSNFCKSM